MLLFKLSERPYSLRSNLRLLVFVCVLPAALVSALKVPPASPLTVRGAVDLGAIGLGLHNTDPALSGLLMQAGLSYQGSTSRLSSVPGTPISPFVHSFMKSPCKPPSLKLNAVSTLSGIT